MSGCLSHFLFSSSFCFFGGFNRLCYFLSCVLGGGLYDMTGQQISLSLSFFLLEAWRWIRGFFGGIQPQIDTN